MFQQFQVGNSNTRYFKLSHNVREFTRNKAGSMACTELNVLFNRYSITSVCTELNVLFNMYSITSVCTELNVLFNM